MGLGAWCLHCLSQLLLAGMPNGVEASHSHIVRSHYRIGVSAFTSGQLLVQRKRSMAKRGERPACPSACLAVAAVALWCVVVCVGGAMAVPWSHAATE